MYAYHRRLKIRTDGGPAKVHELGLSIFLRVTAGTAIARLSHCNSVCLSVRYIGGSVKNVAS